MTDSKIVLDVIVASNVLLNVALTEETGTEPDISSLALPYDELLYGFIGLNAKVISILREEGLEEFQIRKEIRGYADEVSDLDALFFIRDSEGTIDPRTEAILQDTPPEKAVAEIIAVIFGIFVESKQDALERFVMLQSRLLDELTKA
jgi:hypothetical protein